VAKGAYALSGKIHNFWVCDFQWYVITFLIVRTIGRVGQLNGNRQKGMLQIDAPPVEIFWLRHWAKSMGLRAQRPRVPPKRIKGYKSFTYATRRDEKLNRLSMTSSFGNNCTKVTEIGHLILTLSLNLGSYTFLQHCVLLIYHCGRIQ